MSSRARRAVALLTSAALLAGCVTTREGRIGADDGTDPCRAQLVALDSTGNFFGEAIIQGAAVGAVGGALIGGLIAAAAGGRSSNIAAGAAIGAVAGGVTGAAAGYWQARQQQAQDQAALNSVIAGDLAKENAELDRTQLAFNQLMDCRFAQAGRIRNDYAQRRLSREAAQAQMANLRAQVQRDVQLAQSINQRIAARGAEFDTAIENVAPGTKDRVLAGARTGRPVPSQARSAVALKLRPDANAPDVARLNPREPVTIQSTTGGFALVETASGIRGYAPVSAFPEARNAARSPTVTGAQDGDVRSLAASNIARRDNFNESVANAERAVQGFELAG